jgi:hypothetical protein
MISYLLTTPFIEFRFLQAVRELVASMLFQGVPLATDTAILEALAVPVEGEQIEVPAIVVAHFASHFITQKSLTLKTGFPRTGI